jgi:nitrous oxidase accessory protein NosD
MTRCTRWLLLVLALVAGAARGQTPLGGRVDADSTLTLARSPYRVSDSLSVGPLARLTIEPGVVVRFAAGAFLRVRGELQAVGTATDSIVFTADAAFPAAGSWAGLRLQDVGHGRLLELRHARIEFTTTGVRGLNCEPTIRHCLIRDFTESGIWLTTATFAAATIDSVHLTQRFDTAGKGVGVNLQSAAKANLRGVHITNARFGVLVANGCEATLTACTLRQNCDGLLAFTEASYSSFGQVGVAPRLLTVTACDLTANTRHGVILGWNSYSGEYRGSGAAPTVQTAHPTAVALAPLVLTGCDLSGNGDQALYVGSNAQPFGAMVKAEGNYWGDADGRGIPGIIRDHTDDSLAPMVDFVPLLDAPGGTPVWNGRLGGLITRDTTWSSVDTQQVLSHVYVRPGARLTIAPGTVVRFHQGAKLQVAGELLAQGTAADSIIFTSLQGAPAAGDWQGLVFDSVPRERVAQMDYCRLEYAQTGVRSIASEPTIRHCLIRDFTESGVWLTGETFDAAGLDTVTVTQRFDTAGKGAGVNVQNAAKVALRAVQVSNARVGVFIANRGEVTLNGCVLQQNYDGLYGFTESGYGSFGSSGVAPRVLTVSDCRISQNLRYGILVGWQGSVGEYRGSGSAPTFQTGHSTAMPLAPLIVTGSDLSGNGDQALYVGSNAQPLAAEVRAQGNYWGTAEGRSIPARIHDHAEDAQAPMVDFIPFLASPSTAEPGRGYAGGLVTRDTTWTAADTIQVLYPVYVRPGARLTLAPGTVVRCAPGVRLHIAGELSAEGTATDSIVFTSLQTAPAAGDWQGLVFENVPGERVAELSYCRLEFARTPVRSITAEPSISHCVLRDFTESGVLATGATVGPVMLSALTVTQKYETAGLHTGLNFHSGAKARIAATTVTRVQTGVFVANECDVELTDCNLWANTDGVYAFTERANSNFGTAGVGPRHLLITASRINGNARYGVAVGWHNYQAVFSGAGSPPGLVTGSETVADLADLVLRQCDLSANGQYGLFVGSNGQALAASVDAQGNYWGTDQALSIGAVIRDYMEDSQAPSVDFVPFLAASAGALASDRGLIQGLITADTTWAAADTQRVLSSVYVRPGVTLTIEPGTVVRLGAGTRLAVSGGLVAEGTEADSIVFTSAQRFPASGDWSGVVLADIPLGRPARLAYVVVEYASTGIRCQNSLPVIAHSQIRDYTESGYWATGETLEPAQLLETTIRQRLEGAGRHTGVNLQQAARLSANGLRVWRNYTGVFVANGCRLDLVASDISGNTQGIYCYTERSYGYFGTANTPPTVNITNSRISANSGIGVLVGWTSFGAVFTGNGNGPGWSETSGTATSLGYPVLSGNDMSGNGRYALYLGSDGSNSTATPYTVGANYWGVRALDEVPALIRDGNDATYTRKTQLSSFLAYPGDLPTVALAGDLDGDGAVTVLDLRLLINQVLGVAPISLRADLNSDGGVNIVDVRRMINVILGIEARAAVALGRAGLRFDAPTNGRVALVLDAGATAISDLQAEFAAPAPLRLVPAPALAEAGKELHWRQADGRLSLLVTGVSSHPLSSGVVAWFQRLDDRPGEAVPTALTAASLSGQPVPIDWVATTTLPRELALLGNYPNPFNPSTTLRYTVPESLRGMPLQVRVLDLLGQPVRTLVVAAAQPGVNALVWDGLDAHGTAVGSGVYLCELTAGAQRRVRRVVLSR